MSEQNAVRLEKYVEKIGEVKKYVSAKIAKHQNLEVGPSLVVIHKLI